MLEKFGVRPDQVVDVLALMGDSIDNIKGVPGIGEKGARELIAAHGIARGAARGGAALAQKRYREALVAQRRLGAGEPRAGADSHRCAGHVRAAMPCGTAAPSRERCYALFSSLGFRTLVAGVRADGEDGAARLRRLVASRRGRCVWRRRCGASGASAWRPSAAMASAVRAAIVGWSFSTAPGSARYIPTGHSGLADHAELCRRARCSRGSGRCWPTRSIAKVGHDLKFATIAAAREGIELEGADRRHHGR